MGSRRGVIRSSWRSGSPAGAGRGSTGNATTFGPAHPIAGEVPRTALEQLFPNSPCSIWDHRRTDLGSGPSQAVPIRFAALVAVAFPVVHPLPAVAGHVVQAVTERAVRGDICRRASTAALWRPAVLRCTPQACSLAARCPMDTASPSGRAPLFPTLLPSASACLRSDKIVGLIPAYSDDRLLGPNVQTSSDRRLALAGLDAAKVLFIGHFGGIEENGDTVIRIRGFSSGLPP